MEQKHIGQVSSSLKGNYQSALQALDKKNPEYAIMLLKGVVQKEPGFKEARELLRKIEKEHTEKLGALAKLMCGLKISAPLAAGNTYLAAKKPMEALKQAEEALAINLSSLPALSLHAKAAEALDASFLVIETLEIAHAYYPKNLPTLNWLAEAYAAAKQGTNCLRIRQEIARLTPGLEADQKVREAAALASMEQGNWEDSESDYRSKLKDQEQSVKIEQQDRIVRNVDDVNSLIEYNEKLRKSGKDSLDIKRKLADLYQKADQHDKAIEYFEMVTKEMGALDPLIDRGIEKSNIAKIEASIAEWTAYLEANPDKKEEADASLQALAAQKLNYRMERAVDRVNSYPNDLQLRYELACLYYEAGDVENAIQQFQMSLKNPQRRLSSMTYLGRCFKAKGQHDLAIEQFNRAIEEMVGMDSNKMEALYHLGLTYEETGKMNEAMECFKKIYQANVRFRDVADRINKFYAKK